MISKIRDTIRDVLKKVYSSEKIPDFSVEETSDKFGDYSTNVAMILAAKTGEKPQEIAQKIVTELTKDELFEKVEMAGSGFINFIIAIKNYQKIIPEIIAAGDKYGQSDLGKDLKYNIEFISANPTGPLTLGNGRGGFCGDVLSNVLEKFGAKVEREYYINDRGVQITALGHSILKDSETVYKGDYIDKISPKISIDNPEQAGEQAAAIIMEEYIKKTIEKMGIKFDRWFSEKSLHFSGQIEKTLEMLAETKLTYKKNAAIWLKTTEFGDDKDRVLVTKDGEYTYFISDIAYHTDKIRRSYNFLIDFWGADHHGYIGRLKAAIEIIKKEENWSGKLEILIAQLVRLMENGQEVKMSKRAGTYITIDEVIDEVGLDATRFFFLERALNTHMDFNLNLAKEKSQNNPVYYVQYAYARICSILAKSNIKDQKSNKLDLIKETEEIALIKELIKLPDLVEEIAENYQVQKLPSFATQLATSFHNFYEHCRVIDEKNPEITLARMELVKATQIVLKNTFDLMGISSPEKM